MMVWKQFITEFDFMFSVETALALAESARNQLGLKAIWADVGLTFEKFDELLQIIDLRTHLSNQVLFQFHRIGQLENDFDVKQSSVSRKL